MKSLFHSEFFDATRYMVFSHGLKLLKIYLFFELGLQKKKCYEKDRVVFLVSPSILVFI